MNKLNCFAIIETNSNELELLDLNFTDTSNIKGIEEYVKNVLKIDTFNLYFTPLDYDHYKQLWNEVLEDYEIDYRFL